MTGQETWRLDALCAAHPDKTLWDADVSGETAAQKDARHVKALQVCLRCPVARQCGEDVLPGQDEGIRGGRILPTLGVQRNKGSRDAAECGTPSGYNRHRKAGEQACGPCTSALAEYYRERRYRRRVGAA